MGSDLMDRVEHGYADSNGVKIHYASIGEGPLVVMIHGFPDFWYSWRHQMEVLSSDFQVVAIDQRGYNKSDQPDGDENYDMRYLVGDVAAVIRHLGRDKATIVGHDWGGAVAWQFAFHVPQMTERLMRRSNAPTSARCWPTTSGTTRAKAVAASARRKARKRPVWACRCFSSTAWTTRRCIRTA